jgi:hypothetical protein
MDTLQFTIQLYQGKSNSVKKSLAKGNVVQDASGIQMVSGVGSAFCGPWEGSW